MNVRPLYGSACIVVLLALAEGAVRLNLVSPYVAPAPSQVVITLVHLIDSGRVLGPLANTLLLLFTGYILASVAGIAIGLLMGRYRTVFELFEPTIELLRPIPKPALLPPLMLFLGFGATMEVTIVFLGAFFPVLINAIQGALTVDPVALNTARTFRVGELRVLRRVVFPAAVPLILSGMKVALGLALVLAILSEMLSGSSGVGFQIIDMQRSYRIPEMYAWVMVVAAIGLVQSVLFDAVGRRLTAWNT